MSRVICNICPHYCNIEEGHIGFCGARGNQDGKITAVNLKNVIVTNGYICDEPLSKLLPFIDALNIDLKAFNNHFYKNISGDLEKVKQSIKLASGACHVEVTTLIVPGENDDEIEIRELAKWLASVSTDIPLHLTRFFPRYKMAEKEATKVKTVYELAEIAREYLKHVYEGNC